MQGDNSEAPVPNILLKYSPMSTEMYINGTFFFAPVVLQGGFKSAQYYQHFMQLVDLLKLCLSLEISEKLWNKIDEGF